MSKMALEDMSVFEQARWYAIVEAINIVADECEHRNKNFNAMKISPLDLVKYIEGTCDTYARKIEAENQTNTSNALTIKLNSIVPIILQEA